MGSPRENWLALRAKAASGEFRPKDWNWCVGENRVPVNDPASPKGWRYENRVCIFVMGDGNEQVLYDFPLDDEPSPETWEVARRMIRETFGVERIINGVG